MGFETSLFVQQPVDENLLCTICHAVFHTPTSACANGHTYCRACVEMWAGQGEDGRNRGCPDCRSVLLDKDSMMINQPVQRIIMGLQVRCPEKAAAAAEQPNTKNAGTTEAEQDNANVAKDEARAAKRAKHAEKVCNWQGTLASYLETHSVKECAFAKAKCPDCKTLMPVVDLQTHKQERCPERTVTCDLCEKPMRFRYLDKHQKHYCPEAETECSACKQKILRKLMGTDEYKDGSTVYTGHLAVCPELEVRCEYFPHGCCSHVKRKDMKEHLANNAVKHNQMLNEALKAMQEEKKWADFSMAWLIPVTRIGDLRTVGIKSQKLKVKAFTAFLELKADDDDVVHLKICLDNPPSTGLVVNRVEFFEFRDVDSFEAIGIEKPRDTTIRRDRSVGERCLAMTPQELRFDEERTGEESRSCLVEDIERVGAEAESGMLDFRAKFSVKSLCDWTPVGCQRISSRDY